MRHLRITLAAAALAAALGTASPAHAVTPATHGATIQGGSVTTDDGWGWRHRRHFGRFGFGGFGGFGFPIATPFFGGGFGFGGECIIIGGELLCPVI